MKRYIRVITSLRVITAILIMRNFKAQNVHIFMRNNKFNLNIIINCLFINDRSSSLATKITKLEQTKTNKIVDSKE